MNLKLIKILIFFVVTLDAFTKTENEKNARRWKITKNVSIPRLIFDRCFSLLAILYSANAKNISDAMYYICSTLLYTQQKKLKLQNSQTGFDVREESNY